MGTVESGTTPVLARVIVQLADGVAVREYRPSDAASLSHHASNRAVWNTLRNRMPQPYTEEDAMWWINHCRDPANHVRSGTWTPETSSQGPARPTNFAITVNDEAVGSIGLDFKDDVYFRTAELGYWLGEEHWGKGIMSRVAPAFVQWAWTTFEILVRIDAQTYETNRASHKVLEKAGFVYEGRRPDVYCKNGVIGAELMWGALRPR